MSSIQYTVRSVPEPVDQALRKLVSQQQKSLNAVILETLERGLEQQNTPVVHHDLDFAIGTWVEDPQFDKAMEEFGRIDEEMWK